MSVVLALVVTSLLLAVPAGDVGAAPSGLPAQQLRDDAAREKLVAAQELVNALEYERAGDSLLELLADPELNEDIRFEANMQAGIVQRIIGNDVEARLHFVDALQHNPEATLPGNQPPKIVSFFELVKREQRSALPPPEVVAATSAAPTPDEPALSVGTLMSIGGASVAAAGAVISLLAAAAAAGSYYGLVATTLPKDTRATGRVLFFAAASVFGVALLIATGGAAVGVTGAVIE